MPDVRTESLPSISFPSVVSVGRLADWPTIRSWGARLESTASPWVDEDRPPVDPAQAVPIPAAASGSQLRARPQRTRIRPPRDAIRLRDRLYYWLQPPLETLLADRTLSLPHTPFPYQLQGIAFLYPRLAAVLADEMGLGKTMQAITAMRLLLRDGQAQSILLVCPKPLVGNWLAELARWAPELPAIVIGGSQTLRHWQWTLPEAPLRIVNYEILTRDADYLMRANPHFDLCVLDEAQRIKNAGSSTHQAICALSRTRSWALTGTPVENRLDDLVSIFQFAAPGVLSVKMAPADIAETSRDYILRRTKDEVLPELPPKLFRDECLELTAAQQETYELAEKEGILRLTRLGHHITIQHVFELIVRLKQICNFDPVTSESSKLVRLQETLDELLECGEKVIVFSQWVDTLQRLQRRLGHLGATEYHGRIPHPRREEIIRNFREDKKSRVLLMSYGTGGVGLNLQCARYVFLFDRWWNPAVEDQAINRAHRIGSTVPVTVTRYLVASTIEERIDAILQEKRELSARILTSASPHAHLSLTRDEAFRLFNLQTPQSS